MAPEPRPDLCPACGTPLARDEDTCPNCGADVRGAKRATESQRETRVEPSIERDATDDRADDAPRH